MNISRDSTMPFDGTNFKVKIAPLQTGLTGLKQLGDVLRWMPLPGEWDFGKLVHDCGTKGCAMFVAHCRWPDQLRKACIGVFADHLNIRRTELYGIFGATGMEDWYGEKIHDEVTPHDVADAIDRYIAEKE